VEFQESYSLCSGGIFGYYAKLHRRPTAAIREGMVRICFVYMQKTSFFEKATLLTCTQEAAG
jgi:hypothetical protein